MSDFATNLLSNVVFKFPKFDQPHKFNNMEKCSEPCDLSTPNASWSTRMSFKNPSDLSDFEGWCNKHFMDCKSRNPNLGEYRGIHSKKTEENG